MFTGAKIELSACTTFCSLLFVNYQYVFKTLIYVLQMKIYQLTVDLHVRVRGKGVVHVKSLIRLRNTTV